MLAKYLENSLPAQLYNDCLHMFVNFEPTSFMGIGWVKMMYFIYFDPFLEFWSFWPPKKVGSKYFFYNYQCCYKINPKNMFMHFEPTSLMGLGWVKMIYLSYFDRFWSFDHVDPKGGAFKVMFWLIINIVTKCDPKTCSWNLNPPPS